MQRNVYNNNIAAERLCDLIANVAMSSAALNNQSLFADVRHTRKEKQQEPVNGLREHRDRADRFPRSYAPSR